MLTERGRGDINEQVSNKKMKVVETSIGRVFMARLEEGERLPDAIEQLAGEKKIRAALVLLLGGAKEGQLVVGPAKAAGPPAKMDSQPAAGTVSNLFTNLSHVAMEQSKSKQKRSILTQSFSLGHEILGVGTIFNGIKGPELHLHTAVGRGKNVLVGCGRTGLRVNVIVEAVILELTGIRAERELDPASGFHLLNLK